MRVSDSEVTKALDQVFDLHEKPARGDEVRAALIIVDRFVTENVGRRRTRGDEHDKLVDFAIHACMTFSEYAP